MKNNIFKNLIVIFLLFALTLNAQTILINNSLFEYDDELRPSMSAVVDPEVKLMKKAWNDYTKDDLGVKLKNVGLFSKKNIQKAEGVLITTISEKPINLYSGISKEFDGTEVVVFASYLQGEYISQDKYPKEYEALKYVFNDFLFQTLNKYYSEGIKSSTKEIASLKKEKIKLQKSMVKNEKKITKLTKKMYFSQDTQDIKEIEKINKLSETKTKLENENRESVAKMQEIGNKLVLRSDTLDKLNMKYKNLVK